MFIHSVPFPRLLLQTSHTCSRCSHNIEITLKIMYMTCNVQMINCYTGEIYYTRELGYAFTLCNKNDVGLTKLTEIIHSAIRGAREKEEPIQLRLMFMEVIESQDLPFPKEDR